jgi:hypothetical protein
VSQTVSVAEATIDAAVLPERVQEALGQLLGAAKEAWVGGGAFLGRGQLVATPRPVCGLRV